MGRLRYARDDRSQEGASKVRAVGLTLAVASLPLHAAFAYAQGDLSTPDSLSNGWYAVARAGAIRTDNELSSLFPEGWVSIVGVAGGVRSGSQVSLGGSIWWGDTDPGMRGIGAEVTLEPWARRPLALQPVLLFGVEAISVDDGADRGPAIVVGGGARRHVGAIVLEAGLRNRFLSAEHESPDGAIDRDTTMWELSFSVGRAFGGGRR